MRPFKTTFLRTLTSVVATVLAMSVTVSPQVRQQQVPFVGCPSDGQAGYEAPPLERPRTVDVRDVSLERIAYYTGTMAPGAFAPRGWHCHVWYGSGGGVLLVTPGILDPPPGSAFPPKTLGPAVELVLNDSGASGRHDVAKYALLFFPKTSAKFIQSTNESLDIKISQRSLQPFAKDSINAISNALAEFVTPSNSAGFGTEQFLRPSPEPITGITFLDQSNPDAPNFVTLRIRLNSASQLQSDLLRLNRDCMENGSSCSTR